MSQALKSSLQYTSTNRNRLSAKVYERPAVRFPSSVLRKSIRVRGAAAQTGTQTVTVTDLTACNFTDFMQSNSERLIVVDYHTPKCGPCKFMSPIFEEMALEFNDVVFGKFDCANAENKHLAMEAGVRALPTFHLYRYTPDGALVLAELTGVKEQELRQLIQEHRYLSEL